MVSAAGKRLASASSRGAERTSRRQAPCKARPEQGLLETRSWSEEQRPGVGDEFCVIVDRLMGRILENPQPGP